MRFYREWLKLEKDEFRILSMLADKGNFKGNLSDICRYFLVTPQSKNRLRISNAIAALEANGLISYRQIGRSFLLSTLPIDEGKEIEISKEHYDKIRLRPPSESSVSWEAVLKVYLWCCENRYEDLVTNQEISDGLNMSTSVICSAKKVLDKEFGAIGREKITERVEDGSFRTVGQHLGASAFWKD